MKVKKAAGFIFDKYKETSVCESCGSEFMCGASLKGCWCMNYKLSEETLAELKTKFARCLCPNCLDELQKAYI